MIFLLKNWKAILGGVLLFSLIASGLYIKSLRAKVKGQDYEITRLEKAMENSKKAYELSRKSYEDALKLRKRSMVKIIAENKRLDKLLEDKKQEAIDAKNIADSPVIPFFTGD